MRRGTSIITTVATTLVLAQLALTPVRETIIECDPVTGSTQWHTEWPFGIVTGRYADVSPLEVSLNAMGSRHTPIWKTLTVKTETFWGGSRGSACSSAPPIYYFKTCLDEFVRVSSPAEITAFAAVFQSGTAAEQEAAIDAASSKIFGP